jgi:hypothetical protein
MTVNNSASIEPMCSRIVQATSPEEIAWEFGADLSVALRESLSTPAPGDSLPLV